MWALLYAYRIYGHCGIYQWTEKDQIRMLECTGWSVLQAAWHKGPFLVLGIMDYTVVERVSIFLFSLKYPKSLNTLFHTFLVACIAWQTHWDHVVRLHWRWCRYHTFSFCSITFEGTHWFYLKSAEVYIIVKYRSSLILVIICQILAELWPFFDLVLLLGKDIGFHSLSFEGMHWCHQKFELGISL